MRPLHPRADFGDRRAFAWAGLLVATLIMVGGVAARRYVYLWIELQSIDTGQLADFPDEFAPSEAAFDDYYTIEFLDKDTIAIGEPRYWQQNYSYLIVGQARAILFDSGSYVRNIKPIVDSLTSLPVTVFPSHLHYDHVGNLSKFERTALIDLPRLREQTRGEIFSPALGQHLGFCEEQEIPHWRVTEWWSPNLEIDLGGRVLKVLSTPGHTPESAMLFDANRGLLFAGDYIYEGSLYAFLPGSNLASYAATADMLLGMLPNSVRVYTAHRATPPGAPLVAHADLTALRKTLRLIRSGEADGAGVFPVQYRVNNHLNILTDHPAFHEWN